LTVNHKIIWGLMG